MSPFFAASGRFQWLGALRSDPRKPRVADQAQRRFSGFTCYAALADIRASNIEEVSYQILLGDKKYFVSTDGGGERQQWFALIREPPGGVDPEPTAENPTPKLDRLRREFADGNVYAADADGKVWDGFRWADPDDDGTRGGRRSGAPRRRLLKLQGGSSRTAHQQPRTSTSATASSSSAGSRTRAATASSGRISSGSGA